MFNRFKYFNPPDQTGKEKIDIAFLERLIDTYVDGIVLNHVGGMMMPNPLGSLNQALKPDVPAALNLLEEALQKKFFLALLDISSLPENSLTDDQVIRKNRCVMEGRSSDWLLSEIDQSDLQGESAGRIVDFLEKLQAEKPEIFNDPNIIDVFRRQSARTENFLSQTANTLLSSKTCPVAEILEAQSISLGAFKSFQPA